MIKNLIFDWSGTLVDDLPPTLAATNAVLREFGVPELTRDAFRDRFRLPYMDFYREMLGDPPPGAEGTAILQKLEAVYHAEFVGCGQEVTVLPHSRELLELCRDTGRRTFAFTALHPQHFAAQAEEFGLAGYFDEVYTGVADKVSDISRLMGEQNLDPAETAFVGDMVHDIQAAKAGGIQSIAVLTGYDKAEKLLPHTPDILAGDLSVVARLLGRLDVLSSVPVATVGALIFDPERKMLMVRTQKWGGRWGIPGGKIRRGEASGDALRREILEETGLEVSGVEFVMVQDCIEPPEFHLPAHFFLMNYTAQSTGGDVVLNDEAQDYRWVTAEEVVSLDLNTPTRVLVEEVFRQKKTS